MSALSPNSRYFDQRAEHLLASARAVIEHVRTVYVVDGTPFPSR